MRLHIADLALVASTLLGIAAGHTVFSTFYVDGVNQGDGVCVRMPINHTTANYPLASITGQNVACGVDGETAVSRVCPVQTDSTLTFEYRQWPDTALPGAPVPASFPTGHYGPCSVWMKKVDSLLTNGAAAGDGWFKIYDETYDETAEEWCTTKMINNNGHLSAKIPSDIAPGYYLVRPELLALHFAVNTPPDPQFYVGCAQVFVESTGTATPATINIPDGYVNYSMPAMTYNIYATPLSLPYPSFGPDVYTAGSASTSNSSMTKRSSSIVQTEGLQPDDCVMVNANWCGYEVPSYTDQAGCWAASDSCWNQSTVCFATNPPTGPANCWAWNNKCYALDDQCEAGNYNGPPNAGTDLTPTPAALVGTTDIFKRGTTTPPSRRRDTAVRGLTGRRHSAHQHA